MVMVDGSSCDSRSGQAAALSCMLGICLYPIRVQSTPICSMLERAIMVLGTYLRSGPLDFKEWILLVIVSLGMIVC